MSKGDQSGIEPHFEPRFNAIQGRLVGAKTIKTDAMVHVHGTVTLPNIENNTFVVHQQSVFLVQTLKIDI